MEVKYHIIFDVSNMFHRSFSVYKMKIENFSLENKDHQGMLIRKFVTDSCSILKKVGVANVYFAFDKFSFRKNVSDEYKGNRSSKGEAFYNTLDKLYDLLAFKKLNPLRVEGLEADDCIALMCEKLNGMPKIIVSSDEDVRQLIAPRTYVLTPHSKNRTLYKSLYSVHPPQIDGVELIDIIYPQYIIADKFLKGCKGDNILPLVKKGFRTEKVKKFADVYMVEKSNKGKNEHDSLKKAVDDLELEITSEQIENQLKLIRLKSEFMPKDLVDKFKEIKTNDNRAINFEVETILSNTSYWDSNYRKN